MNSKELKEILANDEEFKKDLHEMSSYSNKRDP
jgi:hypothetical protein